MNPGAKFNLFLLLASLSPTLMSICPYFTKNLPLTFNNTVLFVFLIYLSVILFFFYGFNLSRMPLIMYLQLEQIPRALILRLCCWIFPHGYTAIISGSIKSKFPLYVNFSSTSSVVLLSSTHQAQKSHLYIPK